MTERSQRFTIEDVYAFEDYLAERHPQNEHVRETIRDKMREFWAEGLLEEVDDSRSRE